MSLNTLVHVIYKKKIGQQYSSFSQVVPLDPQIE